MGVNVHGWLPVCVSVLNLQINVDVRPCKSLVGKGSMNCGVLFILNRTQE